MENNEIKKETRSVKSAALIRRLEQAAPKM